MARSKSPSFTRKGSTTRERLLAAVVDELVEREGALEVTSVAARAGVSVGLLYRYFGSRTGAVAAATDDFYERLECQVLTADPAPGGDWATRERLRTERAVAFHYEEPLARVVLTYLMGEPEVAAIVSQRLQRQIEMGAKNIARAQREGELRADHDPALTAAMILGGIRQVLAEVMGRKQRPAQAALVDEIWRFIAAAVGVEQAPRRARGQARRRP